MKKFENSKNRNKKICILLIRSRKCIETPYYLLENNWNLNEFICNNKFICYRSEFNVYCEAIATSKQQFP